MGNKNNFMCDDSLSYHSNTPDNLIILNQIVLIVLLNKL